MINFFVCDVDVYVKHLERHDVLSVTLVGVVRVADHVPKHNLDVFLGVFKGFQFSDEYGSIFVLFSDVIDSFLGAYRLARGVGGNVKKDPRLLLCPDKILKFFHFFLDGVILF